MLPITAATSGGSKLFVDEGFPMLNYAYLVVNALKPNEPSRKNPSILTPFVVHKI